ncbi:MAG: 1,4-dihydroxy-6-naphthoate synthase [Thermodesulfobacteriota bacterium]
MGRIRIGYSPCPNDTFIFAHLEKVAPELGFEPVLEDVETLNRWAMEGRLEVTKLSMFAFGRVRQRYGLLHCGAALGRGCGPIVVGRCKSPYTLSAEARVASPGKWTTAALLMGLFLGKEPRFTHMEFSHVLPSVARGDAEFGLVIHEGRFTYRSWQLELVMDLGQWWEETTRKPIPLGGIAIRRDLGEDLARKVDSAIRASLELSLAGAEGTMDHVLRHAQEMDLEVVKKHIELYVTEFTRELGPEGTEAVEHLLSLAVKAGLIPQAQTPLMAYPL